TPAVSCSGWEQRLGANSIVPSPTATARRRLPGYHPSSVLPTTPPQPRIGLARCRSCSRGQARRRAPSLRQFCRPTDVSGCCPPRSARVPKPQTRCKLPPQLSPPSSPACCHPDPNPGINQRKSPPYRRVALEGERSPHRLLKSPPCQRPTCHRQG